MKPPIRGLHSFTLELNFSNSRTHSWINLGYTVDRRAQVELKWERVQAPAAHALRWVLRIHLRTTFTRALHYARATPWHRWQR